MYNRQTPEGGRGRPSSNEPERPARVSAPTNSNITTRGSSQQTSGSRRSGGGLSSNEPDQSNQNPVPTLGNTITTRGRYQQTSGGTARDRGGLSSHEPEQSNPSTPSPTQTDAATTYHIREEFQKLRHNFALGGDEYTQASSARRYQSLADNPLDDFIAVVQIMTIGNDSHDRLVSEPRIMILKGTGVTWQGQPVAVKTDFPANHFCAVSTEEIPDDEEDTSAGQTKAMTAGLCPIITSNAVDPSGVVKTWLAHKVGTPAERFLIKSGKFLLAVSGPVVGANEQNQGRPGIPFAQSTALMCDLTESVAALEPMVEALRISINDVEERADKTATVLVMDDNCDGLWATTAVIPLPQGHNMPIGASFSCTDDMSTKTFINAIANMTNQPKTTWDWIVDPCTAAWFRATTTDKGAKKMANICLRTDDENLQIWWDNTLQDNQPAEEHKLWIHPVLAIWHQLYLKWWTTNSSSPTMMSKYARFVDLAMQNYTADPAPLGTPHASGATFLLTLYNPDIKTWITQFSMTKFRDNLFRPKYISKYGNGVKIVKTRTASTQLMPLLSPMEKTRRGGDDEISTVSDTLTITSAQLMARHFATGLTPQKTIRSPPKKQRVNRSPARATTPSESLNIRLYQAAEESNTPTQATIVDLCSNNETTKSTSAYTEETFDGQGLDKKIAFMNLPTLQPAAARQVGIPIHQRVFPGTWRTPAITAALRLSSQDFFSAEEVGKTDAHLISLHRELKSSEKWGAAAYTGKKDSDDKEKSTAPPETFNPEKFRNQTLPALQTYILFACAYRPSNPHSWTMVTVAKGRNGLPNRIDAEQLTFPGRISAAAHSYCQDTKRGATPDTALEWIMATARNATRLRHGPVKADFHHTFSKALGRTHLFKNTFLPVKDLTDANLAWTAIHWAQSAHDHCGKLRIPAGGYSARMIRNTTRNTFWFHYLVSKSAETEATTSRGATSFSHGGLLADKLLRLSEWIDADGLIESAWEDLEPQRKEKASAHFFTRLSDLFEIFQRWKEYHPRTELVRCEIFDTPSLSDLFVLENNTFTQQGNHESVSIDLQAWQENFDRDFSESFLPELTREYPAMFPTCLKPETSLADSKYTTFKRESKPAYNSTQQSNIAAATTQRGTEAPSRWKTRGQPQEPRREHTEGASDRKTAPTQRPHTQGECQIAKTPSFRLKSDSYKGTTGAHVNFGNIMYNARKNDKSFPTAPKLEGKSFCLRFMTAQCGCTMHTNPRYARAGQSSACDKVHLELSANGNADSIPRETIKELIKFVRDASALNEIIEPTPELIARSN